MVYNHNKYAKNKSIKIVNNSSLNRLMKEKVPPTCFKKLKSKNDYKIKLKFNKYVAPNGIESCIFKKREKFYIKTLTF